MKRIAMLVAGLAMTVGLGAQAQTGQTPPKPPTPAAPAAAPKADEKAPATPAGKWTMTLQSPQGAFVSTLELKVDGKKVTGTSTNDMLGTQALEGEFADGKVSFWMSITMPNGGGSMDLSYTGALKADGTMAGTMTIPQMGEMPWTAERIKEK
jgi:hypothetical protein